MSKESIIFRQKYKFQFYLFLNLNSIVKSTLFYLITLFISNGSRDYFIDIHISQDDFL